ncbi:MAG: sel1 repeat family protein [Proteobacteria bacterium]|nr:sel1 repeat family protein [Pseudomonadota bacterium]
MPLQSGFKFHRGHGQTCLRALPALILWAVWTSTPILHAAAATHEEVLGRWAGKTPAALRAAATQGNAEAQHSLAHALLQVTNASQAQQDEAIQWLRRAADQQLAVAQAGLGAAYFEGKLVPVDYLTAWKWMRAAAAQNLPYAQNYLGSAYWGGWGTNPDLSEAVRWFRAAKDYAPALNNLGWLTLRGQGGLTVDNVAGLKLIRQAADLGHPRSQDDMGWIHLRGFAQQPKNPALAVDWFKKSAALGYSHAQFHLANAYAQGDGIAPDMLAAVDLYRKAADQGHAEACFTLAEIYVSGEASPRNADDSANFLYERAADGGQNRAATILAGRLRWGFGCTPDVLKACGWLCQASREIAGADSLTGTDDPAAEESRQFAAFYLMHRRACQLRDVPALLQMGRWCTEGKVAPTDFPEAYKWLRLAQQRGSAAAETELATLRGRMTPEQIKDGDRRVAKMNR